jgi:heme exporter protein C
MVASLSRRADQLVNGLGIVTLIMLLATLYLALVVSPPDAVMGDRVRILYFHAPAAWLAYLSYAVTALSSVVYLWKRDRRWDRVALASAELAVVFTSLTLVLGSLWGKSVWGTWWTWDSRLTLTLILWFVYVGYLMLRAYTEEGSQQATLAAVLSLMSIPGALINHFAVLWWRTQHPQPIVIRPGGPSLDPMMQITLMVGVLTYTLLYVYLMVQRVRLERTRDAVEQLKQSYSF